MKRKFHDFLTLLTSTEKQLTQAGFEPVLLREHRENHEIFSFMLRMILKYIYIKDREEKSVNGL